MNFDRSRPEQSLPLAYPPPVSACYPAMDRKFAGTGIEVVFSTLHYAATFKARQRVVRPTRSVLATVRGELHRRRSGDARVRLGQELGLACVPVWTPRRFAAEACGVGAFHDQGTLELGACAHHVQHQATTRIRGIDGVGKGLETDAAFPKLGDGLDEVGQGPTELVDFDTTSVSPRLSAFMARLRPGRVMAVPLTPWSVNTFAHPASLSASRCNARVWQSRP